MVHQLDLMTDLLGTPPPETIARVCSSYYNLISKVQALSDLQVTEHLCHLTDKK